MGTPAPTPTLRLPVGTVDASDKPRDFAVCEAVYLPRHTPEFGLSGTESVLPFSSAYRSMFANRRCPEKLRTFCDLHSLCAPEVYFATVWRSTFTLFQIMTLDQWNESVVRHVVANQPAMLIFFLIFVCISSLGLMSIMIGVVVENTLATANKDQNKLKAKRERDRKQVFSQLQEIFEMADVDGSGTLTIDEVEAAIQKPEIYNKLKMIDFPVDDPGQIFALLDYDESGELTTEEFITGCIRMKGPAKSKDLLVAQVGVDSMRKQYALFEQEMEKFQAKVAMLDATIRAVMSHGEHVFLDTRQYRMRHPDFKAQTMKRLATSELENMPWNKDEDGNGREAERAQALALTEGRSSPQAGLGFCCFCCVETKDALRRWQTGRFVAPPTWTWPCPTHRPWAWASTQESQSQSQSPFKKTERLRDFSNFSSIQSLEASSLQDPRP